VELGDRDFDGVLEFAKIRGVRSLVPLEEARVVNKVLHQEVLAVDGEGGSVLDLVQRSDGGSENVEDDEVKLSLLHRVEEADVAQRPKRGRKQTRAHVDYRHRCIGTG